MKPADQHERVEVLLQLSQGGDATPEQIEELNDLLRNHKELRFLAVRSLQFDSMLQEELQVRSTATRFGQASQSSSRSTSETTKTRVPASESAPFFAPWMLVLAASFIGVAMVYSTLLYNTNQSSVQLANNNAQSILVPPSNPSDLAFENVMTVTYQEDAQWDREIRIGDQIDVGHFCLQQGVSRLNTVYGAVVILDARERPVRVQIKPDRSLTVHEGTVLAKVYDQALGFALRTPTTHVVDIGTEFAVSVDSKGQSDVTVLDGAVTWLPVDRAALLRRSMLAAGKSIRFRSPSDIHGLPLEDYDKNLNELRTFAARINSREDNKLPFVHESFEYPLGVMNKVDGGTGWQDPWFKHSNPDFPPSGVVRQGGYLLEPAWLTPSSPRYPVVSLASVWARTFATPIDLSIDQDVFISFLMRKRVIQSPPDDRCGAGITLRSGFDSKRFGISIDMRDRLTVFTGTEHAGGTKLKPDETYLLVVKLELHKETPDGLFAKAYTALDPPAACEPINWDVIGIPSDQDGTIDQLRLWSGATAIAAFDEIRIGTSWSSVIPIRH